MKKLIWVLLTVMALLMMTACGTAETDDKANGTDEGNGSSEVVENNDEEVAEETETETDADDEGKVEEEEKATEKASETIREEAAFVGVVDPHSIEVNTEFETIVLQTLDVQDVDFEAIEDNAHVIIEYYKNAEGQNILTKMEVK